MAKPNGGIVGQSIIPGTGQLFGVYSATTAASLTSAGLYSTGNVATTILAVADPVTTLIVYTDSVFANSESAVATSANTLGNISIFGTNFVAGSTVYIAGQASAYTNVVNTNQIQTRVPSLWAGTYSNIMIMSPSGSGILSNLSITTVNIPVFTSATTLSFAANTAFSTTISATGATEYSIVGGSLPANVSFDTTTGVLSGNVTVNALAAAWNFDVSAIYINSNTVPVIQNHYLVFNGTLPVSYLVVGAGGGAGGAGGPAGPYGSSAFFAGGGGAGGMITGNTTLDITQTYQVGVGSATSLPLNGTDSWINSPTSPSFGNIAAYGGGAGGIGGAPPLSPIGLRSPVTSRPGGSGGANGAPTFLAAPFGIGLGGTAPGHPEATILGNPGSAGGTGPTAPGGGGGAGSAGIGSPIPGGYGQAGVGVYHGITGANVLYARGGGDENLNVPGFKDVRVDSQTAWDALMVPNTGHGATAEIGNNHKNGTWLGINAQPGIVVLSYISQTQVAIGGTVTTYTSGSDKYYVHKFTNNAVPTSTFVANSAGSLPVWTTGNIALTANYYNAAVSTQLRAYNATAYAVATANTLPTGLSLTTGGVLSGTATSERASFYINATSVSSAVRSQEFSLAYTYPTPVWVTTSTLPAGNTAVAYSQQLSATVNNLGSVVYSVTAGNTVPDGLSLSSGGLLSGSFTTTSNVSYSFYVRAAHSVGSSNYSERQFTMNVTYVYPVTLLVVAGGGAGGGYHPTSPSSGTGSRGGGGAGGYREFGNLFIRDIKYTVTVGAAGASTPIGTGGSGQPSSVIGGTAGTLGYNTLTSTGGGGGGSAGTPTLNGTNGGSGGSGGGHGASIAPPALGGAGQNPVPQGNIGAPYINQGYPGQSSGGITTGQGGGGGGAAGFGQPGQPPGGTSSTGTPGTFFGPFGAGSGGGGGRGRYSTITGANVMYAAGANAVSSGQFIGATNTGNGGSGVVPANGGSGVVVLSVPNGSYTANFSPAPVVSVTNNGPQTVMTFTQSGTYTS